MNNGLRKLRVSDLGRVVTGKTPPTAKHHLYGDVYPFITPTDIGEERHCHTARAISEDGRNSQKNLLLPARSICVTCIASIGKTCMTKEPSFTNQQINSVIVDEERFDPFFVYHLLKSTGSHLKAIASGAATPILNKTSFSEVEVEVPDFPTQRKIAGILSAYDDLIENNLRRIRILEEMAQSLYREWFVHFRFRGHESVPLTDSPLGPIPQGWEVKEFREVFKIKYGKTLPKTKISQTGYYAVYGAGGVIGYYDQLNCPHKSALVTSRGNGSGTVWRTRSPAFVTNNSLVVESLVNWQYSFVEQLLGHSNVMGARTGSAQPQMTIENLNYVKGVIPTADLIDSFGKFSSEICDSVDGLIVRNQNLRQTRDLLLPKLLSATDT